MNSQYQLIVNSDRGPLKIKWNDLNALAEYATLQSGLFGGAAEVITKELFFSKFPDWSQRQWDHRHSLGATNLPDNSVIIDVGSGIAVQDLLLHIYLPNSTVYLLDKNQSEFKQGIYYSENYPFYNSWGPVLDAINSSEFDKDRFQFLDPTDAWPEADCITSYYSWCFHYPKETYWNKCLESLKLGGKLVLDVRLIHDRDIVAEISDEFGSMPSVFEYINTIPKWIDNYQGPDPTILGHRCVWTRNR
jgi:hypothetical protein